MTGSRPLDLTLLLRSPRRPPKRGFRRRLRWLAVCWGLA
jgi:hypothetical protein